MEKKFDSLTIFEFQTRFPDDRACLAYLSEQKWGDGYRCPKCGNNRFCAGEKEFNRQCTKCRYISSPTSGTLFHKVKFPLLKAFYLAYYVSTSKKGISSTELSRKLGLRQKTCWLFKQKVMNGMKSSGQFKISGMAEVDETVVGGQEEGVRGRKNKKEKAGSIWQEQRKTERLQISGISFSNQCTGLSKILEHLRGKQKRLQITARHDKQDTHENKYRKTRHSGTRCGNCHGRKSQTDKRNRIRLRLRKSHQNKGLSDTAGKTSLPDYYYYKQTESDVYINPKVVLRQIWCKITTLKPPYKNTVILLIFR